LKIGINFYKNVSEGFGTNENVTSEKIELKQAMFAKCSNWTQHLCCNVDVVLYVATFCIITS